MKFSPNFTTKLPNVGTTIFAVMSKMSDENNAINLSRGFPDFNCSERLIDLVHQKMKYGLNQYAPVDGLLSLRDAIAQKLYDQYTVKYNPMDEVTITSGATEAIYTAISAFVKENDEVIVFEPAYDCYVPAIEMNGGHPVFIKLKGHDFHIDWDEVQKAISPKTRMILLNSPHNPTGSIVSAQDLEKLKKIVLGTDIIILSDEVYENMVYDEVDHQSIARFPQLAERSIIIYSFGKTFHVTGWRVGYCAAPTKLMTEFRKVHQYLMYTVNTPIQYALAEFLQDKNEYLQVAAIFQEKRNYFQQLLKNTKFQIIPCKGTYFQCVDYSQISQEKDRDFAEHLIKEFGVASIPVSPFYHDKKDEKILRFCFAKNKETLEKAAERLAKL